MYVVICKLNFIVFGYLSLNSILYSSLGSGLAGAVAWSPILAGSTARSRFRRRRKTA